MRIMIDTNILLSALVFGSENMAFLLEEIAQNHTMVICSYVIDEFRNVVTRKSPKYNEAVDAIFTKLSYEMVYTPQWQDNMPNVKHKKDRPILAAAILADVDVVITGDREFASFVCLFLYITMRTNGHKSNTSHEKKSMKKLLIPVIVSVPLLQAISVMTGLQGFAQSEYSYSDESIRILLFVFSTIMYTFAMAFGFCRGYRKREKERTELISKHQGGRSR